MLNKTLTIVSRGLSFIFSPLLMPTYAALMVFLFSYLCFAPTGSKVSVIAVTFAVSCMLPVIAIYLLYRLKKISDPVLNDRRDRLVPYVICALCYTALAVYYFRVHAPSWMTMFMIGAVMATATCAAVNTRWKISGHATGMGGLTALAFMLVYNGFDVWTGLSLPVTVLIIAGAVGTARLVLDRHTLGQVAAGFLNGLVWVLASQLLVPA